MGFMDKIKGMVNPDDNYDEYDEYEGTEAEGYEEYPQPTPAVHTAPAHQTYGGGSNTPLELKVVRPERFDSVTQIADHLLNGRTVVLNLEATNKETARRMIDFLSGVAYSIEGVLKKVANTTYVITPDYVDVENEAAPATNATAAPKDLYNGL